MISQVDPAVHPDLRRGDRLLLIGGDTVRRVSTALEALREQPATEIVAQRGDEIVTVSYVRPGLQIDWSYLVQAVIGGLYLLIGLYTVLREQSRQSLLFYLWCAVSSAFFILVATPADQLLADDTGKALFVVEELARLLLPPLTLHFFLTFPVGPPAASLDPPPAAVPLSARDLPRGAAVGPHRQRRPLPARLADQHHDGERAAAARPRRAPLLRRLRADRGPGAALPAAGR